jgi:hypothetical protein
VRVAGSGFLASGVWVQDSRISVSRDKKTSTDSSSVGRNLIAFLGFRVQGLWA